MAWGVVTERTLLKDLVELGERQVRLLELIVAELLPTPVSSATTAVLSLGGPMPLSVGGTTTATLTFNDATGAPAAPPTGDGSGLTVTFNSSDVTIASVGTSVLAGQTYTAEVTGVAAGTYSLNAAVENTSGAALTDDDGTTAFIQPAAAVGTVTASAAAQATTAVITIA